MAQKAPVRVCLLIPLLVHGVCGTTAALEVNFQQDDTVLLQLGTDATSFDLDRVSSRKGVPTVTSMVLHVNASQQKGQRQVEAADHMVNGASWSQLGQDIDGEAPGDQSGKSVSLSSDGSRVAIGAINNGGAGYSSGHVRVFGLSGNTWSQLGQDIDGEASYDYSGWSVSLSSDGSRVAIGASYNGGAGYWSGHVRVFGLSGNTWSQLGQDIDGEASGDYSGGSVSLSSDGSRVAIGAYFNDGAGSSSGHVRVFGIEAPTPVPSPAPPAMTAAAVGDPHLVNMYGQRFDLLKVGKHLLVEVPQFAAESATLLAVAAVAQRLGDACSDVYFVSLNVTGKWADGVREGGFHYTAKQPQAHRKGTGWLSFHSIQLKTVWGRTGGGISYLNLFVKNLGKSGYPVGGLLGGGDHASVTKPVLRCKRELVL
ncbi:unnamed protein product [Prorocentrum cordatum]|uniref:Uncharacterized protein n=1 Tax=Prorocentrum cordatum TaxID=2364126 RepID=A0ABN9VUT5_9DINO|nr:unnamed protein product [Polarella glacialis]